MLGLCFFFFSIEFLHTFFYCCSLKSENTVLCEIQVGLYLIRLQATLSLHKASEKVFFLLWVITYNKSLCNVVT